LYGRFEIRARIDTTSGSWPAIWTLGLDPEWPWNGEIDLLEFYRVNGAPTILANVPGEPKSDMWLNGIQKRFLTIIFLQKDPNGLKSSMCGRMDWTSKSIKLYLDGELLNETLLVDTVNPDGTNPSQNLNTFCSIWRLAEWGNLISESIRSYMKLIM
jgi:hypothetical protein